jgi:hypothetical protein
MFRYAYDHYLNEFDFFHIGGDDHYVIVENLRYTVSTGNWQGPWNDSEPLFLGGSLAVNKKIRYCNGGVRLSRERIKSRYSLGPLTPKLLCFVRSRDTRSTEKRYDFSSTSCSMFQNAFLTIGLRGKIRRSAVVSDP